MKRLICTVAIVLCATVGCTSSVPDLRPFESLKLTAILPRTELHVGEEVQATLHMINSGPETVVACLGEGKGFHIFGTKADRGSLEVVNHESCMSPFRLNPGESMSWSQLIVVGDVGLGAARLSMFVRVVTSRASVRSTGRTQEESLRSSFQFKLWPSRV